MDQTKLRKNYADCRHSTHSDTLASVQNTFNKKKTRHKSNLHQPDNLQPYDLGYMPYAFNFPAQARIHPSTQRLFPTTDSSVCHYPVPFSFSLEHVSLPLYSPLLQAGGATTAPLERVVRLGRTGEQKVPAIFQTCKQNSDAEQEYISLPPVNCDLNSKKPRENVSTCKRRFSDPGVAQISSDESSGRSNESSKNSSMQDLDLPCAYGLIEQMNELKENNSHLMKELHELKLELESLKMLSVSWRPYSDNLEPGKLSDSIVEVREAIKMHEEGMLSRMMNLFEKNASFCKEEHRNLEEKLKTQTDERLEALEQEVARLSEALNSGTREEVPTVEEAPVNSNNLLTIQQQLLESEQEILSLRKELQEAIDSRKKAEVNTLKLERLVSVLRKKIKDGSIEPCMDDKQNPIRPLATSFEQNPFIIANNKHSHKTIQQKRCIPQKKAGDMENSENCPGDIDANGGPTVSNEGTSLTAKVTITGPVTDL